MSVASILGQRPESDGMSDNELEWWLCFSFCRPLEPTRQDWMEARLISSYTGISPREARKDWFDPMLDEEMKADRDAKVKEELEELNRKNKENADKKNRRNSS
ncbi:MAG: hypothetical protein NE327_12415 [Lentisphaeraceae bacterium]|nr:hypothetical protein [Lentisphaeraceae bacterium]